MGGAAGEAFEGVGVVAERWLILEMNVDLGEGQGGSLKVRTWTGWVNPPP